jgi:hypothetical protein
LAFGESPHAARPPVASTPARAIENNFLLCIEFLLGYCNRVRGVPPGTRACGIAVPAVRRRLDVRGMWA